MKNQDFIVKYSRSINYYETDKMGITHHSNYIRFMEESRIYYLETINCNYNLMENLGIISPVISINCDYKLPTTFGDKIIIEVELSHYNGVKFEFSYKMINEKDSKVVFVGSSWHCFTSKSGKPIIIKKQYPKIDEIMKNYVTQKDT